MRILNRLYRPYLGCCSKKLSSWSPSALLDLHPDLASSQAKVTWPLKLLDVEVAGEIAGKLLRGGDFTPDIVFDCNAGPGVLTRQLLQQGAKCVVALEPVPQFSSHLQELCESRSHERLVFMPFASPVITAPVGSNRDDQLQSFISQSRARLQREPEIVLFSTVSRDQELQLTNELIRQAANMSPVMTLPNTRCIVAVTGQGLLNFERQYNAKPGNNLWQYRASSVLIQTLYELRSVTKYRRESFYPKRSPLKKNSYLLSADNDHIFLLELGVQKQAFDWLNEAEKAAAYKIFVMQMMQKRKSRFIPTLEKLVPDCGLRLIDLGYTMVVRAGDIPADKYLAVFKEVLQWPEFDSSPLWSLIEQDSAVIDVEMHNDLEETTV